MAANAQTANVKMKYYTDIVFCIDGTESMGPLIEMVKTNALKLYGDIQYAMAEKGKHIEQMRLRIVVFRDYADKDSNAMLTTDFYTLPEDNDLFSRCVHSIVRQDGGDLPEDGLEALAFAIRSPWMKQEPGKKYRQIIVVYTDAPTHELGYGAAAPSYPEEMPKTFAELTSWWMDAGQQKAKYMDKIAKRLVLFAPYEPFWSTISDNWDNVVHFPSTAGEGCSDKNYQEIITLIAGSI